MAPKSILLINPPLVKPSEAPAGIARLAHTLASAGVPVRVLDANLEGLLALLESPQGADDTWSRRAIRNLKSNTTALRTSAPYTNRDRYKRAVMDLNRVLAVVGEQHGVGLSLSNYSHGTLSPLSSRDLLQAARRFEENPFYTWFHRRLDAILIDFQPEVIGLSVNFISQALNAFAMAGVIRQRFAQMRIVMGGGLITSWRALPGFDDPFGGLVDNLVAGPGEAALLALCNGGEKKYAIGRGYDYDSLPMRSYLSPGTILPVATATGCWWRRCAFCPEKTEAGGYQPLPPQKMLAEIHRQAARLSPVLIHFLDNALAPRFLKALIQEPPGVPWYGFVRFTDHLTQPGFVAALKASGCVMLKLGLESGDQAVLDGLHKGIRLETVSRSLGLLKKAGIAVYAYLLFGTPVEDISSARRTLAFTLEHADCITFLNLAIFNLPAHSLEAQGLRTKEFYHGDLSLYADFEHPLGWHRAAVRRFLEKEFKKPAAIRAILANDPPFFTSNHAPFFFTFG